MEIFYFNSSILNIHKPSNSSGGWGEMTLYEQCKHMPEGLIFYLILQFINMFLGIPANLMVLWLLHKNKGDSSSSDIFILHLAILDTFFCLSPPLELANIIFLNTNNKTWDVLNFFYGVKDCSLLFLSCICLDRYMAVLHPITFTELKDRSHRTVCATVAWLVTIAYGVTRCVGNIPNFRRVFIVMLLAAFAFMFFCNVAILRALRQSGPGRDEMHPVKKRAFKMVLIILGIIVFNYFPPVALFPFQEYFSLDENYCYVYPLAFSFMDISSSIQPVLYLSREIPRVLCCCPKKQDSGRSTDPS
ncbi:proteinase-activated receptor 3-like [Conger conger]|uniref:proteinase-activated receptor 3-like n=1 Tax=Conger conger TaxID=82655 RepID=UPI002A5A60A3|nr:proteinase-activated receptor 3-like [Conger conger]